MYTDQVDNRTRTGGDVAAAARINRNLVAERLQNRLELYLEEGESVPDILMLQTLVERLLQSQTNFFNGLDEQTSRVRSRGTSARKRRDRVAADMRTLLIRVRNNFASTFGEEQAAEHLCLGGETPTRPDKLATRCHGILEMLAEPLPRPLNPAITFQTEEWTGVLAEQLAELEAAHSPSTENGRSQ